MKRKRHWVERGTQECSNSQPTCQIERAVYFRGDFHARPRRGGCGDRLASLCRRRLRIGPRGRVEGCGKRHLRAVFGDKDGIGWWRIARGEDGLVDGVMANERMGDDEYGTRCEAGAVTHIRCGDFYFSGLGEMRCRCIVGLWAWDGVAGRELTPGMEADDGNGGTGDRGRARKRRDGK